MVHSPLLIEIYLSVKRIVYSQIDYDISPAPQQTNIYRKYYTALFLYGSISASNSLVT
jgi:hypothetical protein